MEDTTASAKETALGVLNTGYNFARETTQFLVDNSGNIPELLEDGYQKVKRMGSRTLQQSKEIVHKVRTNPGSLSFMQTLILFTVVVVGGSIFMQQIAKFYDKNLPTFMMGLIKFLLYVVIPSTAAGGVLFGMYLEHRFQSYPDVIDTLNDIYDKIMYAVDFTVKKIRSLLKSLGLDL